MVDALLMDRILKTVIGGATIMGHVVRPVKTDYFAQDLGAASRVDDERRGPVVTDPAVELGEVPSHAPAGFVRRQMGGGFDPLLDLLVDRLQALACAQDDLSTGAAGHGDAKELSESVGD